MLTAGEIRVSDTGHFFRINKFVDNGTKVDFSEVDYDQETNTWKDINFNDTFGVEEFKEVTRSITSVQAQLGS